MALVFIAIDPDTTGDHCPAVFVEEETGDLLFQGWTITDPQILAEVAQHSPVADNESVVRLPARMRAMIWRPARQPGEPTADRHGAAGADQARRLPEEASEGREPGPGATVARLMDEYAAVAGWDVSTRQANDGFTRRTIKPVLGPMKVRKVRGCNDRYWSRLGSAITLLTLVIRGACPSLFRSPRLRRRSQHRRLYRGCGASGFRLVNARAAVVHPPAARRLAPAGLAGMP
ncbi:MAG TPA: hypothetical protein VFO01_09885 [Trebonia sp.]|nr:hypothetical protein [Trebonia sp.]